MDLFLLEAIIMNQSIMKGARYYDNALNHDNSLQWEQAPNWMIQILLNGWCSYPYLKGGRNYPYFWKLMGPLFVSTQCLYSLFLCFTGWSKKREKKLNWNSHSTAFLFFRTTWYMIAFNRKLIISEWNTGATKMLTLNEFVWPMSFH